VTSRTLIIPIVPTTSIATVLARLPDIPGQVVEVRRVIFNLTSFSAATAVAIVLHHNINLNVTLSTVNLTAQWAQMDVGASNGGPAPMHVPFDPPYDLVGAQRVDAQLSAGTAAGILMIIYTVRREPNRTVWNELRNRTSFEGD